MAGASGFLDDQCHHVRDSRIATQNGFEWDWREMMRDIVRDAAGGKDKSAIARGFHLALAEAVFRAGTVVCEERNISTVALSGGVFQNMLLLRFIAEKFAKGPPHLTLWTNNLVPANDGGLSLGQAALV